MKKRFPISHVLTVYTGYCMEPGVGIAQDVFAHLWPGIFTVSCAVKQPAAAKEIERQYPALAGIAPIEDGTGIVGCDRFMREARAIFGDTLEVDGPVGRPMGVADELEAFARLRGEKGAPNGG